MTTTVQVELDDQHYPIDLDFDSHRWAAEHVFGEGDFPFVVEVSGKRYEIFSNGTFAEEEM